MPQTIHFHLDENVDPRVAAGLRAHGVDVTTTAEAGLRHASDDEQLAYAIAERRTIITQDTDFLRMAGGGASHPGVVFSPHGALTIGQVIRGALLVWEVYEPDEMANRVEYL